jgi:ribonuclease D
MWAARILGWPKVGLADILGGHFGVHANKRFQRYNWGQRPLDPQALTYAWMDSYYLLELRDIQKQALIDKGRWEEAQEVFTYVCQHATNHQAYTSEDYFWRIKGIHDLNSNEQKRLYQLHLWREKTASRLDRPTVKVISNKRLVQLARIQPRNRHELYDAGLTHHQVRRFGSGVLDAMHNPLTPIPPSPTNHERPPTHVIDRYNTLKAWRKDIAFHRGVDSDVILPNAVLWEIAHHPPNSLDDLLAISGIGPWRQATYGPDILKLVSNRSIV